MNASRHISPASPRHGESSERRRALQRLLIVVVVLLGLVRIEFPLGPASTRMDDARSQFISSLPFQPPPVPASNDREKNTTVVAQCRTITVQRFVIRRTAGKRIFVPPKEPILRPAVAQSIPLFPDYSPHGTRGPPQHLL